MWSQQNITPVSHSFSLTIPASQPNKNRKSHSCSLSKFPLPAPFFSSHPEYHVTKNSQIPHPAKLPSTHTVNDRLSAAALILFFMLKVWCLFGIGTYSESGAYLNDGRDTERNIERAQSCARKRTNVYTP